MQKIKIYIQLIFFMFLLWSGYSVSAQSIPNEVASHVAKGLHLRGIGPAVMGGRFADIAIHPAQPSTWYVAVGSGRLWKTINSGITWHPVFDDQASYSIGTVALDANNPEVVWVGTG